MQIVPGRAAGDGLTFWLNGSPSVTAADVHLRRGSDDGPVVDEGTGLAFHRMTGGPVERRVALVAATGLAADAGHTLVVGGADRGVGASRTLPADGSVGPFTIAFGSCCAPLRARAADAMYRRCGEQLVSTDRGPIRMRFLLGDQIYMDLHPGSGDPISFAAPDPFARYATLWTSPEYADFLGRTPTLVMADDHEFWNDYPHGSAWQTWSESRPGRPLGLAMDRAFGVFQASLNLDPAWLAANAATPGAVDAALGDQARTFELEGAPVEFFFLDTRTRRTRYDDAAPRFAPATWLAAAEAWLLADRGKPKVLVLSQPMIEDRAGGAARFFHTLGDVNLPDYDQGFQTLWRWVRAAPRDVMILSGDIHWSRLCRVAKSPTRSGGVYEVISSPLARIKDLTGPPNTGHHDGAVGLRDDPDVPWNVMAAEGGEPRDGCRTDQPHTISTITFEGRADGSVRATVIAWHGAEARRAYARSMDLR